MAKPSFSALSPVVGAAALVLTVNLFAPARVEATGLDAIEALGGDGHQYHAVGDIDRVNLFNGNVTVTVPLASYDVGAHLSYSFTLVYNSSGAWRRAPAAHPYEVIPDP